MPKSNRDFWNEKLERNVTRDRQVQRQLAENSWQSLTIWECETKDLEKLRTTISNFLHDR
jgi:DNA mismatch endonuclease (patch repair protein)